jgi:hypothetical protein
MRPVPTRRLPSSRGGGGDLSCANPFTSFQAALRTDETATAVSAESTSSRSVGATAHYVRSDARWERSHGGVARLDDSPRSAHGSPRSADAPGFRRRALTACLGVFVTFVDLLTGPRTASTLTSRARCGSVPTRCDRPAPLRGRAHLVKRVVLTDGGRSPTAQPPGSGLSTA